MGPQGTRRRRSLGEQGTSSTVDAVVGDADASRREEIVWGKTSGGTGEKPPISHVKAVDGITT